jgi:hypothetical protein
MENDEGWQVHLRDWVPKVLHQCFDGAGRSEPMQLDFDDLDRQMHKHDCTYERLVSKFGDVELSARGRAATVLANWFATAFASGVRM